MDLRGQRIAITGASTGIGKQLALALARRGAQLALGARNLDALRAVAASCEALGSHAVALACDVARPEDCRAFVEGAIAALGGLDALVNNAGVTLVARFDRITDLCVFEKVMQVNYLGAVYCTHAALPALRQSRGLLVAVSSLQGLTGVPTRTAYAASKHALQGFCDSLRIELRGSGVAVLVASPGFVSTEMRQRAFGPDGRPVGHDHREGKRAMTPERCAELIARAMERRQRELVMTLGGKLLRWIKLVAPGLVDALAERAVR